MPSILYSFFCEDLRAEEGGKVMALGLLGRRITFGQLPPQGLRSLALHAYVHNPDRQRCPFRIRISGPPLIQPLEQAGALPAEADKVGHNLNIVVVGVVLVQEGTISGEIEIQSDPIVRARVDLEIHFSPAGEAI